MLARNSNGECRVASVQVDSELVGVSKGVGVRFIKAWLPIADGDHLARREVEGCSCGCGCGCGRPPSSH